MKILMIYAPCFWYKTFEKVLEDVPECEVEKSVQEAVVVLYHAEETDVENRRGILIKFLKNIKWLSGKFRTKNIVLHSFNHLSTSKAAPDFTRNFINEAEKRLLKAGFTVHETPFGYLNEWKIHVAGESLAKVFKDLKS